jgi:hypothetical protein
VITIGFDRGHVHNADTVVFATCLGVGGGGELHRVRPTALISLTRQGKISTRNDVTAADGTPVSVIFSGTFANHGTTASGQMQITLHVGGETCFGNDSWHAKS